MSWNRVADYNLEQKFQITKIAASPMSLTLRAGAAAVAGVADPGIVRPRRGRLQSWAPRVCCPTAISDFLTSAEIEMALPVGETRS